MIDSPTLTSATVANYCVWNPLNKATPVSVTNGNLQMAATTAAWQGVWSSLGVSSGKWYFEATVTANNFVSNGISIGVALDTAPNNVSPGVATNAWAYNNCNSTSTAGRAINGASVPNYGATYTTNDIIGVAVDMDAGSLVFYKNGTSQGTAFASGISGTIFPYVSSYGTDAVALNCGQRPFSYTPPTGYVRLNTFNLPDSTVKKGNTVMDATLYTGNSTTVTATNAGAFKPDLVWIKDRTGVASHVLTDSVRGTTKQLFSNLTNAEQTDSNYVTSFNSNGFTVGTGQSGTGVVNNSGDTFVGWQWQAGQGTNTSNTSGSITSTVSVNATAGFSVVTYTGTGSAGATIGHGLGVAPKMMIIKKRSAAGDNWRVYHASLGATKFLDLNQTSAAGTASSVWNDTAPTSTVWTVGTNGEVNTSTATYVCYAWAEIAGFSKFTSYTGNGSADGPFIFLGFRPKFVMIKRTDGGTNNWVIFDSSRNTYNATGKELKANTSAAEYDGDSTNPNDFLSNGLKIRHDGTAMNIASGTYIVAAWAENPFKNSNAR
jgi:hypothetical protein